MGNLGIKKIEIISSAKRTIASLLNYRFGLMKYFLLGIKTDLAKFYFLYGIGNAKLLETLP